MREADVTGMPAQKGLVIVINLDRAEGRFMGSWSKGEIQGGLLRE
jgi:hypothetical protein